MASGGHSGPATAHATNAAAQAESRRDLTSWWKGFKRGNPRSEEHKDHQGIFGVPLQQSIRYANVAISLFNDEGQSYIYGYVPIVVAKCGVFLKEKATDVEGIFRLAGSEKRIKELKVAFDSPDRYGKGLDWTGYTVHDAANILRRYFNQLPEPIIPLEFYERFRTPLKNHQQQAVGAMEAQSPDEGHFEAESAILKYQALITELPPLNRQLLLYILDLLAVFASKSDLNKMTNANLAAIFQPGLLSHPQHDMAPQEYRLSQDVLIFLIENQDSFLVGMPGTAADEKTVQEVQSGAPTPTPGSPGTPNRGKSLGRSSSSASAGADSVRKWGNLRRNVSVSSKNSRNSVSQQGSQSPALVSPVPNSSSGGVYRSNTLPSKRSVSGPPYRYPRDTSNPSTPSPTTSFHGSLPLASTAESSSLQTTPLATQPANSYLGSQLPITGDPVSVPSSEATTPIAAPSRENSSAAILPNDQSSSQRDAYGGLVPPPSMATRSASSERSPSGSRTFLDIFKAPGSSDGEGRQPKKLQKKRIPGSALSSAQSSAADLQSGDELATSPMNASFFPREMVAAAGEGPQNHSEYHTAVSTPRSRTPHRQDTDTTLRAPASSPPRSYRSASATDMSDTDVTDDGFANSDMPREKKRWRFSQSVRHKPAEQETTRAGSEHSKYTAVSSSTAGSRSIKNSQELSPRPRATDLGMSPPEHLLSDSEERKKGPMSWIRGKIAERKDKDRARSPMKADHLRSESKQSLHADHAHSRGKSMEVPRTSSQAQASLAPVPTTTNTATQPQSTAGLPLRMSSDAPRQHSTVVIPSRLSSELLKEPAPILAPIEKQETTPTGPELEKTTTTVPVQAPPTVTEPVASSVDSAADIPTPKAEVPKTSSLPTAAKTTTESTATAMEEGRAADAEQA